MSEASSTRSLSGRKLTADDLVAKLHRKAGMSPDSRFSLTDHLSAGRILVYLRDALLAGESISKQSTLVLLCTGISLRRRHAASVIAPDVDGPTTDAAVQQDHEDSRALLNESAQLVFILLCLIERRDVGIESLESVSIIESVNRSCLWDIIKPRKRKRAREDGGDDAETGTETEAETNPGSEEWKEALRVNAAEIARHALRIGASQLVETHDSSIMSLYFRSSSSSMAATMLLKTSNDFVALGLNYGDESVSRNKRLLAIVQAAESEAGQSILRDFMLSFLLPASMVGVRRGLLMSRAASTNAGIDHPKAVQRAHDVAMAGSEYIWINGEDELEKMCCLLAGIAILTTKGGDDPIRKLDAFGGRVALPFLETAGAINAGVRLTLVPDARRWILYRLNAKGSPSVLSSLSNFDGLCDSLLALAVS